MVSPKFFFRLFSLLLVWVKSSQWLPQGSRPKMSRVNHIHTKRIFAKKFKLINSLFILGKLIWLNRPARKNTCIAFPTYKSCRFTTYPPARRRLLL